MLSKILYFNKTQKLNRFFFRESAPSGTQPATKDESTSKIPAGVAAARAKLEKQYQMQNQESTGKIPDTSAMVLADRPGNMATQTVDQAGDLSKPEAESMQDETSGDDAEQQPQSGDISIQTQQIIASLEAENAGLKTENAGNAETTTKLTEAVERLLATVAELTPKVEAATGQPPQQDMATEAVKNLKPDEAKSFWAKLKNLTPKQIAEVVLAVVAVGLVGAAAVVAAPAVVSLAGAWTGGTATTAALGVSFANLGLAGATTTLAGTAATVAQAASLGYGAALGTMGFGAAALRNRLKQEETPAEPVVEESETVAVENQSTAAENREQLGKSENINNLAPGTIVKSNISYFEGNEEVTADIKMVVRQTEQGLKYVEVYNHQGESLGAKEIFGKTGDGEETSDYTLGHIQEGCKQVLVFADQPEMVFKMRSFAIQEPAESSPVTELQDTDTEVGSETDTDILEFQPTKEKDEPKIESRSDVSTLVADPNRASANAETDENQDSIKAYNNLPSEVTFKNSNGETRTITTKNFASQNDASKALVPINKLLGPSANSATNEIGKIVKGITIDGKTSFYLDFTEASVKEFLVDSKTQTEATTAPENQAATQESQVSTLNKSLFPGGGTINHQKLTVGINNAVKNWNKDNTRKEAVNRTVGNINQSRVSESTQITTAEYQKALVCNQIIQKGIPDELQVTLDSISESAEYKAKMINGDNVPSTVSPDRIKAFNAGLALAIYTEKISDTATNAITLGESWFKNTVADGKTKSMEINYAAGQELFEQLGDQTAIRDSILNQIDLLAQTDPILNPSILHQVKMGGKMALTQMSDNIQQRFGELVLKAMGKPVTPTNNIVNFETPQQSAKPADAPVAAQS